MNTRARSRFSALRRASVPLVVMAAALAGPGQAIANAQVTAAASTQLPPTPGPASPERTNPQVFALAQDANFALRYSFAAVAADLGKTYPTGTVEADLRTGLLTLPTARRDPIVAVAKQAVAAGAQTRMTQFGRHGALTVEQYRSLGFTGAFSSARIDATALKAAINSRAQVLAREGKAAETAARNAAAERLLDLITTPKVKALDFRVDRVTAVDETNPELGGDSILLGGLRTDNLGVTGKVGQWMVHDDFDDGEVVNYDDPGKAFTQFSTTTTGGWPRSFVAVVMMAEEDSGGFASAVNSAWVKVNEKVKERIAAEVADASSEHVAAAIAEAIGQVVAWLVGAFVDWLLSFFEDDLFEARTALVTLPHRYGFLYRDSSDLGWTNLRLPPTEMQFVGHGGDYRVKVHWQVHL
ncbi:hypothetical protein [Saccharothrix yanglingensis]|uniref:hypothetical protein n=1 Tax=Saccharothrix yanglingensis TaxID=659496 RepID=UPI0027D2704D|nr:hypothetical protein [Saccharothrix yanglingensis]